MSLIMPIMINHKTIGALTISRMEALTGGGEHEYEWDLAMNPSRDRRQERHAEQHYGHVMHRYDDGAVELIRRVMAQIPVKDLI